MTAIIITLVAVVLLILVIGYFAMRFLRAEDQDPFEDQPSDLDRLRSADDSAHDWRDSDRAAPPARRSERGGRASHPADDGSARRSDRISGRGRADRGPVRDDREPVRPARGSARNDRSDRDYADRNADRDYAADRPARFDDRNSSDRVLSEPAFSDRGSSDRSARGGQRPAAAGLRGAAERPPQSRSAQSRSAEARSPEARSAQARLPQGRPAEAGAPGGRSKARNGERSGAEWDSLSDVDYWAELAADKPLTTTAQPAAGQSPAGRREQDAPVDSGPDLGARPGRPSSPLLPGGAAAGEDSTALLPVRRRHAPAGPADSPGIPGSAGRGATSIQDGIPGRSGRPAAGSRRHRDLPAAPYGDPRGPVPGGPGSMAAPGQSAEQGIAALARLSNGDGNGYSNGYSNGNGHGRQAPLNDDPLTSPSFPAVSASDGRSYGGGRPDTPASGSQVPDGYNLRAPQAPSYPAAAPDALSGHGSPRSGSHRSTGRPADTRSSDIRSSDIRPADARSSDIRPADGGQPYGGQPGRGQGDWSGGYGHRASGAPDGTGPNAYQPPAAAPAGAAASYPDYAEPPLATGNPYGSYVSAPADRAPADRYPAPGTTSGRPDSDPGYGGYQAGQETQQYSQPPARHTAPAPAAAPVNAVPMYAAPVPAPAEEQSPAGYGGSWYDTPGANGYGDQTAAYQQPVNGGHGQPPGGYPSGSHHAQPEYPPAAYNGTHYDPPAYPPAESANAPRDQHGYGTPDSGYGADAYGGYPSY
jgi:hypothetical protein